MANREGEVQQSWFRNNRFYSVKGKYFFSTREGVDHGPFDSLDEANDGKRYRW